MYLLLLITITITLKYVITITVTFIYYYYSVSDLSAQVFMAILMIACSFTKKLELLAVLGAIYS